MKKGALLAALGAAGLGVVLLLVYKQRFEARTSGGPRVPVLVASRDVPFGEVLTEDALALRDLPVAYLENRHIKAGDARRVLGVRLSRSVRANESILWSDLAVSNNDGRTLADTVRPGMRALAVPATLPSTFGGLLRPGDRVDALLTTTADGGAAAEATQGPMTVPLLQNLLVLAVGDDVGQAYRVDDDSEDARSWRVRMTTVTVAVTVQQAELLTLAQAEGAVTLVMRHPDDVAIVDGLPEATRQDLVVPSRREQMQERPRRVKTARPSKGGDALDRIE